MNNLPSTTDVDHRDQHVEAIIADDPEAANTDHDGAQLTPTHDPTPPNADGENAAFNFGQYIGPHGDSISIAPDTAEDTVAATGDFSAIQDNEGSLELHGNTQEGEHALHASTLNSPPVGDGVPQAAASTQDEETPEASQTLTSPIEPSWVPFYLRRPFFVGNAVVFGCLIVTLEMLYHFSKNNQGLATVSQDKHYFWTYGPLSLLTIISAFWGQMEYRARQLTPWYLKSNGQGEDWLLLNYLTASTPGSLFRSIKSRHFLVSLGISGSLLLRLLTIFSTGLLSLEYKAMTRQQEHYIADTFDFTRTRDIPLTPNVSTTSSSVTGQFWAISHYNLTVPYEIRTGLVAESFKASQEGFYDAIAADVPVFEAKLTNCQTFLTSANDSVYNASSNGPRFRDVVPDREIEAWRQWCVRGMEAYHDPHINALPPWNHSIIQEYVTWLLLFITPAHKCSKNNTDDEAEESRILFLLDVGEVQHPEIHGLWCEPVYSLSRRTVTNVSDASRQSHQINISPDMKEDLSLGADPDAITSYILYNLEDLFQGDMFSPLDVWKALLNQSGLQNNPRNPRGAGLMEELSKRVWNQFSAFVVEKGCKSPVNERRRVLGTVTSTEGRLCIQILSLRLMELLLGLLMLISISLTFCLSQPTLHRDPGSIAAHAVELARNRSLRESLEGCGGLSEEMLRNRLRDCKSSPNTSIEARCQQPSFISVAPQGSPGKCTKIETASKSSDWWHPTGLTWWFRVLIMSAAVAVAVALQVLILFSRKSNGLANVDLHGYQKYTWTYIPTLVLASLGLAFSLTDSNARALHPFPLLRKGSATLQDLIYDPAARISFFAATETVLNHQFTLSAIVFTGLLAPILTIAASGLYIPEPVLWTPDVTFRVQDWFEVGGLGLQAKVEQSTGDQLPGKSEDFYAFQFIQQSDMPYPMWTHDQYAFSTIQRDNLHAFTDDSAFILNAHTLALRGRFNCSVLYYYTRQNISVHVMKGSSQAFIKVEPPPGCHTSHKNKPKGGLLWFLYDFQTNIQQLSDNYYVANFSGLIYPNSSGVISQDADPDTVCNDNREHYWYSWARVTNRIFEEIAIIHCVPYIEALLVNASFSLPTFQLMSSAPIVPNEASATVFSNAPLGIDDIMRYDSKNFFAHLSNDTYGPDFPEVFNIANVDKLIDRVDHLYRIWAAQYLNLARRPANITPPTNTNTSLDAMHFRTDEYYGTITNGTRMRLVQNEVSTRILQGLLITMALCVAVSCILEPHTKILPKDPGSIASKMSLFADGEVWKNIPEGAENWSDEEIKQRGLLQGVVLKMGWWGGEGEGGEEEGGGGGRRWFGVDAVKREGGGTVEGSS